MSEGWNTFQTYAEVIELKKTTAAQEVQIQTLNSQVSSFLSPIGAITMFAGQTPPAGWLLCDGTSLVPSSFSELFAVIGYTYGQIGDNFYLPSLQGRVAIGANTGYPLASVGGSATLTIPANKLPSHSHTLTNGVANVISVDGGHTHATNAVPSIYNGGIAGSNQWVPSGATTITSSEATSTTGSPDYITTTISGNTDSSTQPADPTIASLPPYIALHYIICYTANP